MTRRTNHIEQLPPARFAQMIRDDRDNHDWMAGHLMLQAVAYLDADARNTAPAHYTRQALLALRHGDLAAYNDALDELLGLMDKYTKRDANGEENNGK